MRGRVLRLSNQARSLLNSRGISFYAATASLGAGLGTSIYIYNRIKTDMAINVELPTYIEMRDYKNELKQTFTDVTAPDESHVRSFNALLDAIEVNDVRIAKLMLNDLVKSDIVSDDIRDGLIVFASNHSKIGILTLLQTIFGDEAVMRNRRARDLLDLMPSEKEKASDTLERFYQYPKEMLDTDSMAAFIKIKQMALLEENLRHRALQPAYFSGDIAEDIVQAYRQIMSVQQITVEMEEKFSRTIIIDSGNWLEYETITEDYYRQLSLEATRENKSIVGTMVITGGHFTIAQIKVTPQSDSFNHADIVYIDSLGCNLPALSCYYRIISSLPHHVFDRVKLFVSEEKNQFAPHDCALFVCDLYGTLMNLDQIMSQNTQYSFAGNKDAIFDIADYNATQCLQYGVDYRLYDKSFAGVNDCQLFVLPACLIVGKQSLESNGVRVGYGMADSFELQPDGRYKHDFEKYQVGTRTSVLGLMGINRARSHSLPERQLEFTRPADITGDVTVDEMIAKNLEPSVETGTVKLQNKRIQRLGYELGRFLGGNIREVLEVGSANVKGQVKAGVSNKY